MHDLDEVKGVGEDDEGFGGRGEIEEVVGGSCFGIEGGGDSPYGDRDVGAVSMSEGDPPPHGFSVL